VKNLRNLAARPEFKERRKTNLTSQYYILLKEMIIIIIERRMPQHVACPGGSVGWACGA